MPFHAAPMFPGDLYDTTERVAADAPVIPATTTDGSLASQAWRQYLSLGWQAVLVGEDHGGAGATLADVAAIAEASARHASPAPLAARCGVVPALLARLADQPAAAALLPQVAAGEASVCPALDAQHDGTVPRCTVEADGLRLDGSLRGLDLSEPASHVVFLARTDAGDDLLVLAPFEALAGGARGWFGIDARRSADVALDGLRLPADALLARGVAARDAASHALAVGALISCAQVVGAMGAMIEQTIEYLSTRQQFGVALASFQALRHRTVELYVAYESVRGMVRQRVLALDAGDGDLRQVALVKLYLAVAAREAAESCIQLHGAIGMSRELPASRLAMHALGCSLAWGDRLSQLDQLAGMAGQG